MSCKKRLTNIYEIKKWYIIEELKNENDYATWDDIQNFYSINKIQSNSNNLYCPCGGLYTLGKFNEVPTCSYKDVYLPFIDEFEHCIPDDLIDKL